MEQVALGVVQCNAMAWVYASLQISALVQVYHIKININDGRWVVEIFVVVQILWYIGVICRRLGIFSTALCLSSQNGGFLEVGDLIIVCQELWPVVT